MHFCAEGGETNSIESLLIPVACNDCLQQAGRQGEIRVRGTEYYRVTLKYVRRTCTTTTDIYSAYCILSTFEVVRIVCVCY